MGLRIILLGDAICTDQFSLRKFDYILFGSTLIGLECLVSRPESDSYSTSATCAKTSNRANLQRPAEAAHERHLVQLIQGHFLDGKFGVNVKRKQVNGARRLFTPITSTRWEGWCSPGSAKLAKFDFVDKK